MSARSKLSIVTVSTVLLFYTVVGGFLAHQATAKDNPYAQVVIFDEVLRHIVQDYVDEPDLEKVRIGALRGLAAGLDPDSAFLTPEQVKSFKSADADRDVTGLRLSKIAGYASAVAVVKGSPAGAAGIRGGDVIEYIGKAATRDFSLFDCRAMLNGAIGTEVDLSIFRNGKSEKVHVKRGLVVEPAVESRLEEVGTVGYVQVTSLAKGKAAEVRSRLEALRAKGARKFILDLRNSAGGELSEATDIANFFIKSGVLARETAKAPALERVYAANAANAAFSEPAVILIDRTTAGPTEAIAAAFEENKRGEVVGERTFGAGSRQQLFALHDGAALLLTTVRFASPSGKAFLEGGVAPTPGNEVARSTQTPATVPGDADGNEEGEESKPEQKGTSQAGTLVEDKILQRGLEVLRGQNPARKVARAHPVPLPLVRAQTFVFADVIAM